MPNRPANVFVTRLHLRYNKKTHPEDLRFQITGDRKNFQGRYILRHPWKGETSCEQGHQYLQQLKVNKEKRAQNLANLTGWDINAIRQKMQIKHQKPVKKKSWWENIWN